MRKLGHYEVLEKLGEGGMGVVWKARDTRLDRFVALKVLPAEKMGEPERERRFVQEARAASALNHPNIITIYDIDRADDASFIAMEFVHGKALDQLIPRKGLRLNEALKYATQIADALSAAHAAGIVHRDLKPGNVMVNENGNVKVLDFGLAKLTEQGAGGEFTRTETIAQSAKTEEGKIVGTVSYMSPEQAEGKKVDARSDIFAFGALLYEMLTGRRAFQGDSKLSTLAAILNNEPEPVEQVVSGIPREVTRIVQRCLRKDPQRRAQGMADVKLALEELKEESDSGSLAPAPATVSPKRRKNAWAALLVALVALGATVLWYLRDGGAALPAAISAVPLTAYPGYERFPSLSPEGKQVAFSWTGDKQDNEDIYVKLIGSGSPLRLTSDPAPDVAPAWSPDGGSIAFIRRDGPNSRVMLVPALGGPERELAVFLAAYQYLVAQAVTAVSSTGWSPDGRWVVANGKDSEDKPSALWLVSVESGEKRQLSRPPASNFGDCFGTFSPDGRTLAFVRFNGWQAGDLYVLPLGPDLNAKGEPRRLTNDNRIISGLAWAADGREIVFSSNRGGTQVLWRVGISGSGEPRRLGIGENGIHPAVSRQGNRLVYSQSINDSNIWRLNLSDPNGAPSQLIASTRGESNPQYSPDGKRIAFESNRSGNQEVWVCDADGSNPVQLVSLGRSGSPRWSPDGQWIVFDANVEGNWQIYVIGAHGGRPRRMTKGSANDVRPGWSHDGKRIFFASNRSGEGRGWQVWAMPADGGEPVQVTRHGGYTPFESSDGKTIYYAKSDLNPTQLWRVPAGGGEESQVIDSISINFAISAGGIYFISESRLQYFDVSTQKSKTILTVAKPTVLGLGLSADERFLLYPQIDQGGADLMLVENFR